MSDVLESLPDDLKPWDREEDRYCDVCESVREHQLTIHRGRYSIILRRCIECRARSRVERGPTEATTRYLTGAIPRVQSITELREDEDQ